ncbi:MAG: threonylcarbamoyl-AMP synthase [Ruminococcus bromii]|nr:threonylcarbamoyl-AMP synthase [Ruminococcus bromii]
MHLLPLTELKSSKKVWKNNPVIIVKTLLLKNTEEDIKTAAELLKNGGVVGIPTETVYGLAADALNPEAVKKIFKAKGRPGDNPLIVHICDFSDIERLNLVTKIPDTAKKLADAFWPGPLTMIMKKSDVIPNEVSAGLDTVAIRFPSHKTAQAIIRESGTVLAAPSANISGSPSPTTAQHVMNDMDGKIDAVLDGGASEVGLESTVITLAGAVPRVLRPGGITVGTKEADVLAAYGEPTDSYKDEEYGNTYYWYDKESYDNSCTVETDAETGLVENITLQCYE